MEKVGTVGTEVNVVPSENAGARLLIAICELSFDNQCLVLSNS
jgi:hypothetical protein